MPRLHSPHWLALSLLTLATLAAVAADSDAPASSIRPADLEDRTRILASDRFEGRAPGSRGEELTVQHLAESFQSLGLQPGGRNGSWFQEVPLVGIRSLVLATTSRNGARESWAFPQDFVAWSPRMQPQIHVEASELVFVGYGVVAPEYQWNDFKDADLRGKTLVMLVNDPPIPDPKDPSKLDPTFFRGNAMTYYGRWTYKFEIAAAKGAAAALVIHETGPAGYPYFVVINSWGRENFDLASPRGNADKLAVAGWLSLDRARQLCAAAGHDLATLKQRALQPDFRPIPLGIQIDLNVTNTLREVRSRNVAALLPGQHPERKKEFVVYSAHWDGLGIDDRLPGDKIFNGALDNATGVAVLLEIAEAYARLPSAPDRSVLFLALTAEEQGLLGARYYAEFPLHPLARTLANINMDGANVAGRRADVGVIGYGQSTLEDLLLQAALTQGRSVRPEAEPEKGGFFRSDHFEFSKVGVPSLYLDSASDEILGQPPGYGKKRREEYRENDYHKVTDEMKPWWNFEGAAEDARLLFEVGRQVANRSTWPAWKPGSEFKARREAILREATAATP
ncbi:MAG: M28 family peptidase [Verrucomicrobiales bacterium]|nr:M28 family peptidase [Verrucomicrobiales bacterium]